MSSNCCRTTRLHFSARKGPKNDHTGCSSREISCTFSLNAKMVQELNWRVLRTSPMKICRIRRHSKFLHLSSGRLRATLGVQSQTTNVWPQLLPFHRIIRSSHMVRSTLREWAKMWKVTDPNDDWQTSTESLMQGLQLGIFLYFQNSSSTPELLRTVKNIANISYLLKILRACLSANMRTRGCEALSANNLLFSDVNMMHSNT